MAKPPGHKIRQPIIDSQIDGKGSSNIQVAKRLLCDTDQQGPMKTSNAGLTSRHTASPHPRWRRVLTVLCLVVLGLASTVQVCHVHDDPGQPNFRSLLTLGDPAPAAQSALPETPDSASTILCPLCVAMHSALPVTHRLPEYAALYVCASTLPTYTAPRCFLWRSDLASRPPPAASSVV